jgi:hypothetical protein
MLLQRVPFTQGLHQLAAGDPQRPGLINQTNQINQIFKPVN